MSDSDVATARTGCKRARAKYIDASFLRIIGITAR
jgi:hypothetical protein